MYTVILVSYFYIYVMLYPQVFRSLSSNKFVLYLPLLNPLILNFEVFYNNIQATVYPSTYTILVLYQYYLTIYPVRIALEADCSE